MKVYELWINGVLRDTCEALSYDEACDIFADSWDLTDAEIEEGVQE